MCHLQRNTWLGQHLLSLLHGFSPQTNWSDHRLLAKLVPTFAGSGCRVVSARDPHGRNLGFVHRRLYIFFQATPQL
jgi:hypothetical protein